ncbi:Laminin subunit alpha-2 [Linum perenne]
MFKSWKSKEKFKAIFQLQFQATQVPKLKKPALTVSLVPEDVGKPTFKLEKTAVQEGICLWENPVYVTVKFVREAKTGNLHEKIYHFIVASGSAKKDYLGESSIDFADFAEEVEPVTISLPLKFANSGAVLHDIDDYERDESFRTSNENFRSLARQNALQREDSDVTLTTKNHQHRRSGTEWSTGSGSDGSLVDSTNSPGDNVPRQFHEATGESTQKLKSEILSLMRQSELSELELQTLRKQVTKENKRAQDLSREVMAIKEQRDAIERESDELKYSRKNVEAEALDRVRAAHEGSRVKIEELRKELTHEKELKVNIESQLQKTQESNSELILAVQDLDNMLKEKDVEISVLSSKLESSEHDKEIQCQRCRNSTEASDLAEDQDDTTTNEMYLLKEQITDLSDEIDAYKESRERLEKYIEQLTQDYEDLKQENLHISNELEENRQQQLQAQNERTQYLGAIEELESQLQGLEKELREQTQEQSQSMLHINELEGQVKLLEKELEKQAMEFEKDLDDMTNAKIEQEQRAIRAEEALRKTRWKNASTAERLQEEFKKVSLEMSGKIDDNEKLMTNALAESDKLREQNRVLEEKLAKANEEIALIKDQTNVRVEEISSQLALKTKMAEAISVELDEKSTQLQKVQKEEKDRHESFSREIQMLKAKIEAHTVADASNQRALGETALQRERWGKEKKELVRKYASAKKETENVLKEFENLRLVKDERETTLKMLQLEIEGIRDQHNKLTHSLSEEKLEKENLRKQILQLTDELQKKENDIMVIEKHVKSNKNAKTYSKQQQDNVNLTQMQDEMAQLKERNKRMESELKEMEVRYSDISLKFAEVEGERQQLVMTVRNLKKR